MKLDVDIAMLFRENLNNTDDIKYMKEAFKEAMKAYELNEVPVGCVIVCDDKIIARAHNLRHNKKCSIYHAEMIAIEEACAKLNRWILNDCTIYVTFEPCLMCTGAIIQSRINRLVYALSEERFGCMNDAFEYFKNKQNHNVSVTKGILEEEARIIFKDFFKKMRDEKKNK